MSFGLSPWETWVLSASRKIACPPSWVMPVSKALRVRVDRPELTPADVRSLFVQSAQSLTGVPLTDQGAGVARQPAALPMAIEPAVVSGTRSRSANTRLTFTVHDLSGVAGRYRAGIATSTTRRRP